MSYVSLHHEHRRVAARHGALLSAIIPLALVLAVDSVVFAAGLQGANPALAGFTLDPPAWLVALIWMVIYPMWGLARWKAARAGRTGRGASWWVVALMGFGLAYPLVSQFRPATNAWASLAFLILALLTVGRLQMASRRAAALVLPSVVWIGFATFLGFAALARA